MQAKAVTPATSNSKNYRNTVTVHSSRNASNSKKLQRQQDGQNSIGREAKMGILEKVVKRRPTAGTIGTSWMSIAFARMRQ
jgi:hypothetical protein